MRIIADSNVLLSATISEGPPFEIVNMVLNGTLVIVFSRETWASPSPQPVKCRDPNDQMFLDLAGPGDVDYLITGDDALLSLRAIGRTKIRTPRQFLDEFQAESPP